jgi:hypothetical protein
MIATHSPGRIGYAPGKLPVQPATRRSEAEITSIAAKLPESLSRWNALCRLVSLAAVRLFQVPSCLDAAFAVETGGSAYFSPNATKAPSPIIPTPEATL